MIRSQLMAYHYKYPSFEANTHAQAGHLKLQPLGPTIPYMDL